MCMTNPNENVRGATWISLHSLPYTQWLERKKASCYSQIKPTGYIAGLRKKVENLPDNLGLLHRCWIESRIPDKMWNGRESLWNGFKRIKGVRKMSHNEWTPKKAGAVQARRYKVQATKESGKRSSVRPFYFALWVARFSPNCVSDMTGRFKSALKYTVQIKKVLSKPKPKLHVRMPGRTMVLPEASVSVSAGHVCGEGSRAQRKMSQYSQEWHQDQPDEGQLLV